VSAEDVLNAARAKDVRIATAESCTGGMVAVALTDIPGSSDVVECGFVTYSNDAKTSLLNVSPQTLATFGAVSEEVAAQMARGAVAASNASLAVSITGIAGPGGSEHKPEGRVCFGVAHSDGTIHTETVEFGAKGRANVRRMSCDYALVLLQNALS